MNSKSHLPSPVLDKIQRWFLAVITHPDGIDAGVETGEARKWLPSGSTCLEEVVTRSKQRTAKERLEIYSHAYYARLLECMGEVYPVLQRTLREEGFRAFAFQYLQQHPSRSYTLHQLGVRFPDFLKECLINASTDAENEWGNFLVDLARFEWVLYEVFDGPGLEHSPSMPPFDLQAIPESDLLDLRFRPAPSLRLFESDFPVNDYYTTVRSDEEAMHLEFPQRGQFFTALSRRAFIVRRYPLSRAQFFLLKSLTAGEALGEALERLVEATPEEEPGSLTAQLGRWFAFWFSETCFFEKVG